MVDDGRYVVQRSCSLHRRRSSKNETTPHERQSCRHRVHQTNERHRPRTPQTTGTQLRTPTDTGDDLIFLPVLTTSQTEYLGLYNVLSTSRTRSSSVVTLARASVSSSSQWPTYQPYFHICIHHLTCGISCLLRSVNLILFTFLLVHLIMHYARLTSSQSPPSLSLSLDLSLQTKLLCFTIFP